MAGWIKIALGMEVSLGPGHIVLDGDPAPLPKKGAQTPNFPPIFIVAKRLDASCCHVVGHGYIVLDGDPVAPPQGTQPPILGPYLLWPNGWWIKIPFGMEVGLGPCSQGSVRWESSHPIPK